MTAALEGGEWSAARPGRTVPPGEDPVPVVQEAPIYQVVKSKKFRSRDIRSLEIRIYDLAKNSEMPT